MSSSPTWWGTGSLQPPPCQGQRLVIEALEREGLRQQVKVIVGGAPVSQGWATEIGADGYGEDAMRAVTLVKALLGREAPAA